MANTVLAQQAIGKLKLWSTYFIRSGATFASFPLHVDRLQTWLQFIAKALVTCGSISDLRFDQEPTWLPTLRKAARFGNVLTKTLDWLDGKNVLCNMLQQCWINTLSQCEQVARIYTGMPVYTGILAKSPVFRPYFCDFTRIFVIEGRFNALLSCLAIGSITLWTCTKSQKDEKIKELEFCPYFRPYFACIFTKMSPYEELVTLSVWSIP